MFLACALCIVSRCTRYPLAFAGWHHKPSHNVQQTQRFAPPCILSWHTLSVLVNHSTLGSIGLGKEWWHFWLRLVTNSNCVPRTSTSILLGTFSLWKVHCITSSENKTDGYTFQVDLHFVCQSLKVYLLRLDGLLWTMAKCRFLPNWTWWEQAQTAGAPWCCVQREQQTTNSPDVKWSNTMFVVFCEGYWLTLWRDWHLKVVTEKAGCHSRQLVTRHCGTVAAMTRKSTL